MVSGAALKRMKNEGTLYELQVLGLLGKHLTGLWMTKIYTVADTEISHVDGINIVKELVETLKQIMLNSLLVISLTKDFFGQDLTLDSVVKLKATPSYPHFSAMMAYRLPTSGRCSSKLVCSILRRYGHDDQSLCYSSWCRYVLV